MALKCALVMFLAVTAATAIVVDELVPAKGSTEGGLIVYILGEGFCMEAQGCLQTVNFGDVEAEIIYYFSTPTRLAVMTPPGTGTVDVTVFQRYTVASSSGQPGTREDGAPGPLEIGSMPNGFTYSRDVTPTIERVSPCSDCTSDTCEDEDYNLLLECSTIPSTTAPVLLRISGDVMTEDYNQIHVKVGDEHCDMFDSNIDEPISLNSSGFVCYLEEKRDPGYFTLTYRNSDEFGNGGGYGRAKSLGSSLFLAPDESTYNIAIYPEIFSVENLASGSQYGGSEYIVHGKSFGAFGTDVSVVIGGLDCAITSISASQIICRTVPSASRRQSLGGRGFRVEEYDGAVLVDSYNIPDGVFSLSQGRSAVMTGWFTAPIDSEYHFFVADGVSLVVDDPSFNETSLVASLLKGEHYQLTATASVGISNVYVGAFVYEWGKWNEKDVGNAKDTVQSVVVTPLLTRADAIYNLNITGAGGTFVVDIGDSLEERTSPLDWDAPAAQLEGELRKLYLRSSFTASSAAEGALYLDDFFDHTVDIPWTNVDQHDGEIYVRNGAQLDLVTAAAGGSLIGTMMRPRDFPYMCIDYRIKTPYTSVEVTLHTNTGPFSADIAEGVGSALTVLAGGENVNSDNQFHFLCIDLVQLLPAAQYEVVDSISFAVSSSIFGSDDFVLRQFSIRPANSVLDVFVTGSSDAISSYYEIIFFTCASEAPFFFVDTSFLSGVAETSLVSAPADVLGGDYTLNVLGKQTGAISVFATPLMIADAIEQCLGTDVEVTGFGNCYDGYTNLIAFRTIPGDVTLMSASAPASGDVSVVKTVRGGVYLSPLFGDFVSAHVDDLQDVRVVSHGISAFQKIPNIISFTNADNILGLSSNCLYSEGCLVSEGDDIVFTVQCSGMANCNDFDTFKFQVGSTQVLGACVDFSTDSVDCTVAAPFNTGGLQDVFVIGFVAEVGRAASTNTDVTYSVEIVQVSPSNVPQYGGVEVAVLGSGFTESASVQLEGTAVQLVGTPSFDRIAFITPVTSDGNIVYTIVIDGLDVASFSLNSLIADTPVLNGVSPAVGSTAGGQSVTIAGSFLPATVDNVKLGSAQCEIVSSSDTEILCFTSAEAEGIVDLTVAFLNAGSFTMNSAYEYTSVDIPVVASISSAVAYGGDEIAITGGPFNESSYTVLLGGVECSEATVVANTSNTVITCIVSAEVASANVKVVVSGSDNVGSAIVEDIVSFSYGIRVLAVHPNQGSYGGGSTLTITGNGFGNDTVIIFTDVIDSKVTSACRVTSIEEDTLECIMDPAAGEYSGQGLVATAFSNGLNDICTTTECQFAFSSALTPVVASIDAGSGTGHLTVTFEDQTWSESDANKTIVRIGEEECVGLGTAALSYMCQTPHLAGDFEISVFVEGTGYAIFSGGSPFQYSFSVEVTSVSSNAGSIYGGLELTVTGKGIRDESTVWIGEHECDVTSISATEIACETPSVGIAAGPFEVVLSAGSVDSTCIGAAMGDCEFSFSSEETPEVTGITYTNPVDVGSTIQFTVNSWKWSAEDTHIYFGANREFQCTGVVVSAGNIICTVSTPIAVQRDLPVTFLVSSAGFAKPNDPVLILHVSAPAGSLTTVSGISPSRGGTAGGTLVSITGTFVDAVTTSVWIGTTPCTGVQIADDYASLTCTTGNPLTGFQPTEELDVYVLSDGVAFSNPAAKFRYMDLWSASTTWGGDSVPGDGDTIFIPAPFVVFLDVDTAELNLVVVEGKLIFLDERPLNFHARYCMIINGGEFTVGTVETPFENKAVITMHGDVHMRELPIYGSKVLALREGTLNINGKPRPITWLSVVQSSSSSCVTLKNLDGYHNVANEFDWVAGEEIVLASSDDDPSHAEKRTIDSVSLSGDSVEVCVTVPFEFDHDQKTTAVNGEDVTFNPEVGLLTRNIVFRGDEELENEINKFGAMILMHAPNALGRTAQNMQYVVNIQVRLTYAEFTSCGQASRLGRYPIHFHLCSTVPEGTLLKGLSIHHTFNRAITVHGTNGVTLHDNVAYDNLGHAYFLEDGIEENNEYVHNLAVYTKRAHSLLQVDLHPASFWITNPNNTFEMNHAAGSDAYGFWYQLDPHPVGPSFTESMCPQNIPLKYFEKNEAHSNRRYGLRVFPKFTPKVGGSCDDGAEDAPGVFRDFKTWFNGLNGVTLSLIGALKFENFFVSDCRQAGVEVTELTTDWSYVLENWTIVGRSDGNDIEGYFDPSKRPASIPILRLDNNGGASGLWGPKSYGLLARHIHFENFRQEDFQSALTHGSHAKQAYLQGGFEARYSEFTFNNVDILSRWRWVHEGFITDLDGSICGSAGCVMIADNDLLSDDDCFNDVRIEDGKLCTGVTFLRVGLNEVNPFHHLPLLVHSVEKGTNMTVEWRKSKLTHPKGYMFNFVEGREYNLRLDTPQDPTSFVYGVSPLETDRSYIFTFPYYQYWNHTHVYVGNTDVEPSMVVPAADDTSYPQGTNVFSNPNDFDPYDCPLEVLYSHPYGDCPSDIIPDYLVPGSVSVYGGGVGAADVNIGILSHKCGHPVPGEPPQCPPPIVWREQENFTRSWSDPESWDNQTAPLEGDIVVIKPEWQMVFDCENIDDFLDYSMVFIYGSLTFTGEASGGRTCDLRATHVLVLNGSLTIGTPESPYPYNAAITLLGDTSTPDFFLGNEVHVGAKVLGVMGDVNIHGKNSREPVGRRQKKLEESVAAGSTEITVRDSAGHINQFWRDGDEIAIASSSYDTVETERHTITQIRRSSDLYTITLSEELRHAHTVNEHYSPTVIHLTSNVKIRGDMAMAGSFGAHIFGANVNYFGAGYWEGSLNMQDTEVVNFGQLNQEHRAGLWINFDTALPQIENAFRLTGNAFNYGYNEAIAMTGKSANRLDGNVIYRTIYNGIFADEFSENNVLDGNVVMNNLAPDEAFTPTAHVMFGNFFIQAEHNQLTNNEAAGSQLAGFAIFPDLCNETYSDSHNVAAASPYGVMVMRLSTGCRVLDDFFVHRSYNYGVYSYSDAEVHLRNSVLAYNNIGTLLTVVRYSDEVSITNVDFYAEERACDYSISVELSQNEFPANWAPVGIMMSNFVEKLAKHEGERTTNSYAHTLGQVRVDDVTFVNYKNTDMCGRTRGAAIGSNSLSSDSCHTHVVSNLNYQDTDVDSHYYFHRPDPTWNNPRDCGNMDCSGLHHCLIVEQASDGSTIASIFPSHFQQPITEVTDEIWWWQSVAVDNGPATPGIYRPDSDCVEYPSWEGMRCASYKYSQLAILSLDDDAETRRISPVGVTIEGYTDLMNEQQDKGWCQGYTCEKRLSLYHAVVRTNRYVRVDYTGTAPDSLYFNLLNAKPEECIRYQSRYTEPQKVVVRKGSTGDVELNDQRLDFALPAVTDPMGTHYFDYEGDLTLYFTQCGGDDLTTETEWSVYIKYHLEVSVSEFYSTYYDTFFANLAAFLAIPVEEIYIVNIVPGSSVAKRAETTNIATLYPAGIYGNGPVQKVIDQVDFLSELLGVPTLGVVVVLDEAGPVAYNAAEINAPPTEPEDPVDPVPELVIAEYMFPECFYVEELKVVDRKQGCQEIKLQWPKNREIIKNRNGYVYSYDYRVKHDEGEWGEWTPSRNLAGVAGQKNMIMWIDGLESSEDSASLRIQLSVNRDPDATFPGIDYHCAPFYETLIQLEKGNNDKCIVSVSE